MVAWECPINPREASGLDPEAVHVQQAGRQIGDVVKVVDEHLQNRSEDDQSIQYV